MLGLISSLSIDLLSSVDGHLGCYHGLAIVDDAAVNTASKYLYKTLLSVLLGVYPEVELLDHIVILFLVF